MNVADGISSLIGLTPTVRLGRVFPEFQVFGKLEYFNPAGSTKDRAALFMIEDAEARGLLREGSVIIEPTSGNTGIGLSAVGASRGYRVILTMPDTMSVERRRLLAAYGAEIVLTDGKDGMRGAIEEASRLASVQENSFIPSQFENPSNPAAHYATTGPELWADTDGEIDIFVACVGTGGTVSGIGRYLKEKNENITVVAVEPSASPMISEGRSGAHGIQGIGANFLPKNLDMSVIDKVLTVSDGEAYEMARLTARREGILLGISSGAALAAVKKLTENPENKGKRIVALLPDGGERYLSTGVFD